MQENLELREKMNDREHQHIYDGIEEVKVAIHELRETMTPKVEFAPVRSITYGLVSILLVYSIGSILNNSADAIDIYSFVLEVINK